MFSVKEELYMNKVKRRLGEEIHGVLMGRPIENILVRTMICPFCQNEIEYFHTPPFYCENCNVVFQNAHLIMNENVVRGKVKYHLTGVI